MAPPKKTVTQDAQVNFKCFSSELEYWKQAAVISGYGGEREFAKWVKDTLTEAARKAFTRGSIDTITP